MGNLDLSSKMILILAAEPALSHSLKIELQKEIGVVDVVSSLHEAVVHAILTEPDFIFIEISPKNFSGLELFEILKQLKGASKSPRFFLFAEKKTKESFRQKAKNILFLDQEELSSLTGQIRMALEESAKPESEHGASWRADRERGDLYPESRKEMDILEKLGQLGILKRE